MKALACKIARAFFNVRRNTVYNDWLHIGPVTIHGYGACIAIGLITALLVASFRAKKRGLNDDIIYGIVFCSAIFGFLGAKIMYCIVEWESFIEDPVSIFSSSGFVVYGGITGGIIAVFIYTKIKKVDFLEYLELAVPSVAIAQGFGRLGCFFAGCCYGRPTDSIIGITFKNSLYAPNNVKLIPTQLLSAAGNFINAAILIFIVSRTKKKGVVTAVYLILYSIGRFFIEMLRNDNRGSVGSLSTSQFYGIFTLIIGIGILIFSLVRKEVKVNETV